MELNSRPVQFTLVSILLPPTPFLV